MVLLCALPEDAVHGCRQGINNSHLEGLEAYIILPFGINYTLNKGFKVNPNKKSSVHLTNLPQGSRKCPALRPHKKIGLNFTVLNQ